MGANELRIGNYAMGNKPFEVDANHIAMAHNHEIAQNGHERFESIPLTEDWLIRFGFEKYEGGYMVKTYYVGVYLHLRKDIFNELVCTLRFYGKQKEDNQWMPLSPFLKHVHQLQNLYFSLTGTELTIKN